MNELLYLGLIVAWTVWTWSLWSKGIVEQIDRVGIPFKWYSYHSLRWTHFGYTTKYIVMFFIFLYKTAWDWYRQRFRRLNIWFYNTSGISTDLVCDTTWKTEFGFRKLNTSTSLHGFPLLLNPPKIIKCPSIEQQTESPRATLSPCRFVPNQSETLKV